MTGRLRNRRARTALVVATLAGCAVSATGCAPSASCAGWVFYESTEAMLRDADVVVTTSTITRDGSATLFGVDAARYRVTVAAAEKGEASQGEVVSVLSTPDACAPEMYDGGDPLDTAGPARLYLEREGADTLRTLTPFDGVVPLDD